MNTYIAFQTWAEVLAHVSAGLPTYYHAPLSHRPCRIQCTVSGNKVRVEAPSRDYDPFSADVGHLDRFKRVV